MFERGDQPTLRAPDTRTRASSLSGRDQREAALSAGETQLRPHLQSLKEHQRCCGSRSSAYIDSELSTEHQVAPTGSQLSAAHATIGGTQRLVQMGADSFSVISMAVSLMNPLQFHRRSIDNIHHTGILDRARPHLDSDRHVPSLASSSCKHAQVHPPQANRQHEGPDGAFAACRLAPGQQSPARH